MPTIRTASTEYYYREAGQGPLVVLGHSDASSSAQWRGLMEQLGNEFRLVAFDTSGQGRSAPWPAGVPYTVAGESAVVDGLVAGTQGPIHLVGHSYGGLFLLDAALRLRERVASLTLIEPILFFLLRDPAYEDAWRESAAWGEQLGPMIQAGQDEAAMEIFINYWNGAGSWQRMPEEMRAAMRMVVPKVALQWGAASQKVHPLAAYRALDMPALLIRGAKTTRAASAMVDILQGALPKVRLEEIPGAGHLSPITHADAVNPLIAAHLRQHTGN